MFLICFFCSRRPNPKSSTPALLEMQVKPLTPSLTSSAIPFSGIPQSPKPPTIKVIPSFTPLSASLAFFTVFKIAMCYSSQFGPVVISPQSSSTPKSKFGASKSSLLISISESLYTLFM